MKVQALSRRFAGWAIAPATVALTLSTASAAQAIQFSLTAEASGFDSGFDAVLGDLETQGDPADVQNILNQANSGGQTVEIGGNNFFTIQFNSASDSSAFVESVQIDLRGSNDSDAAFDNQELFGLFNTNPETSPNTNETQQVKKADIQFLPADVGRNDNSNSTPTSLLTINFLNQAFTPGKFFRFGVDTNAVGDDRVQGASILDSITNDQTETFRDRGGDFGNAGVKFLATIVAGGQRFEQEATFQTVSEFVSRADIEVTDVPEPFTILGSMAAIGFGLRLKRQRDRQGAA